jgi:hypothetical protein
VATLLAAAVDGEPLVATGRAVARDATADLLRGLGAAAAAVGAAHLAVALERRAADARAALLAAAPGLRVVEVPDVLGCRDEVALLAAAGGAGVLAVDAAALAELGRGLAAPGGAAAPEVWLTVAGAVAEPGVRRVAPGLSVDGAVALAGGPTCGPAWVALAGGPLTGSLADRDSVIDGRWRALTVLPGGSELARRARGDRRAGAETRASGLDPSWLGAGAPGEPPAAALPLELVALRLGLPWP